MNTTTTIADCGHGVTPKGCGTGYGYDRNGKTICYECCAQRDRETMIADGHSKRLPLYFDSDGMTVSNWPGTLSFKVTYKKYGRHNIARRRIDLWFVGPDGHYWYGVQYGEFTQVVHCKRMKQQVGK